MKTFNDYLAESGEYGFVQAIVTPLIYVSGLPKARPNEVVITENGTRGIVQVLLPDLVEVLMLDVGRVSHLEKVARIGEEASIEVSERMLGRVIDPLGMPLDGLGPIEGQKQRMPIDRPPPGILQRVRVTQPLETGVTLVDLMVQIGHGQKELVAGDQKVGKTAFLLQTVIRQAQLGTVCIYVCIGKKKSDLKNVEGALRSAGSLGNSIVIGATSSDAVSYIYFAPFSGFTIAEFFRDRGQNVVIILDDMTSHAKYYREIALVAKKTPGRGSYPGDIFHHQARLLERAGNVAQAGGKAASITCLPVAETQEGDLTGYIQTNLMAMTDGHIFFDVEEYKRGKRPAVNHSLSVTRVGNQTQSFLEKELRQVINFRLINYYRVRETSSFGVEMPAAYSLEIDFGQKIETLFNQEKLTIITKPLQYILFGLLFSDFWNNKSVREVQGDKEKLIKAHQKDLLTKLETEVLTVNNLNGLKTLLLKYQPMINNIISGNIQ